MDYDKLVEEFYQELIELGLGETEAMEMAEYQAQKEYAEYQGDLIHDVLKEEDIL